MARVAVWTLSAFFMLAIQVAGSPCAFSATFNGYAALGASETQGTAFNGSWVPSSSAALRSTQPRATRTQLTSFKTGCIRQ